jgi:hypothetical protein
MNNEIPHFAAAVQRMREFLEQQGHCSTLSWVFRDDFCRTSYTKAYFCNPLPGKNETLSEKVFEDGRNKGLVSITAIAKLPHATAATVWFPKYEEEEVQGWSVGLKIAILKPLPKTFAVPAFLWPFALLLPPFRRYQKLAFSIGTRKWASGR